MTLTDRDSPQTPKRKGFGLARLFGRDRSAPVPATLAPDRRVYAIGDIHGRRDLLDALLDQVRADDAARGKDGIDTSVVLLGDLIDRGPESAGVVRRAMAGIDWGTLIVLKGNHEAAMIDGLDTDRDMLRLWLEQGGDAALASWGVDEDVIRDAPLDALVTAAHAAIPAAELAWLAARPLSYRCGDYYFVHAGIRPGVPLDEQTPRDAMWIRDSFLTSTRDHGVMVVHGHTRTIDVEQPGNRIGIDTGAYATGRLTALGLEGTDRWIMAT